MLTASNKQLQIMLCAIPLYAFHIWLSLLFLTQKHKQFYQTPEIWFNIAPVFTLLQLFHFEGARLRNFLLVLKNTSLYLIPSYYNRSHLRNIINTQLNRILFQSQQKFFHWLQQAVGSGPKLLAIHFFPSIGLLIQNIFHLSHFCSNIPDFLALRLLQQDALYSYASLLGAKSNPHFNLLSRSLIPPSNVPIKGCAGFGYW